MFTICIPLDDEYTHLAIVIIGLNVETISADVFKLKRVRVDSGYNDASLMITVVPIESMKVARLEPNIFEPQQAVVTKIPGDFFNRLKALSYS